MILLGSALVWTLLKRVLPRRDPGAEFERMYGAEGILGVTESEHRELALPGRCTGCGLCDGALLPGPQAESSRSIMRFVLAGARSMPDYSIAAHLLDGMTLAELQEGQALCPFDVRIVPLASLVRQHAARLK